MHILTWEYAQKKAPFFTLSLDCELTNPFDENATTLTYYLQSRLLACPDLVNRLARYLLKRYIVNSLVPDKKGEARKTLAFCRSLAPTCVRSFCPLLCWMESGCKRTLNGCK